MERPRDVLRPLDQAARAELAELLAAHRQAVLATLDEREPYTAMVACVPEPGRAAILVHLSDLAAHKRHLRRHAACSMLVFEPDDGRREILQHRRVSLRCRAEFLVKGSDEYVAARDVYLGAFPVHRRMFELADFDLVRLVLLAGLLNAGFGRAFRLTQDDVASAVRGRV